MKYFQYQKIELVYIYEIRIKNIKRFCGWISNDYEN